MILDYPGEVCHHNCPYKREAEGDLTCTERRQNEAGSRDWKDEATDQRVLAAARSCGRRGMGSPLEAPERVGPSEIYFETLIFNCEVMKCFFITSHQGYDTLLQQT